MIFENILHHEVKKKYKNKITGRFQNYSNWKGSTRQIHFKNDIRLNMLMPILSHRAIW